MAKRKKRELNEQSVNELQTHLKELDQELFQLRNELAVQQKLEKPHLLKEKRKDRARVLTILTLKQKEKEAV